MNSITENQLQLGKLFEGQQQILEALKEKNRNEMKQLLTTLEAATYLGMSRRKFDEMVAVGEIAFVQLFARGRHFYKKQLDEMIRAKTTRVGHKARDRAAIKRVR